MMPRDPARRHPPRRGYGLYYDPVYGHLELPPPYREAIDLPTVQRLRWVKQLGELDLVFPGATYSRFEHSVGVYHLGGLAFDSLLRKSIEPGGKRKGWPDLIKLPLLRMALELAAVFHDVGHGPWSHTFDLYSERTGRGPGHKTRSVLLIRGEVRTTNDKDWDDIPIFLNDLFEKHRGEPGAEWLKPENVAAIVRARAPLSAPAHLFLGQIVDSTFDVDRLDYLLRDGVHTGLSTGVDVGAILHGFTLIPDPKRNKLHKKDPYAPEADYPWHLAVNSSAADALEGFLDARDLTYRRVYYHPVHRVGQEMMVRAMENALGDYDYWDLAMMDDHELLEALEDGTPYSQEVARRIRERDLYELLPCEIRVRPDLGKEPTEAWWRYNTTVDPTYNYQTAVERTTELGNKLGCAESETILWHLEAVPLSEAEDWKRPCMHQERTCKAVSLLDVSPHLDQVHGITEIHGVKIDHHRRYIEGASTILLSIPYQLVQKTLDRIARRRARAQAAGGPPIQATMASGVYRGLVARILQELLKYLGLDPSSDEWKSICDKFREWVLPWLEEAVQDLQDTAGKS